MDNHVRPSTHYPGYYQIPLILCLKSLADVVGHYHPQVALSMPLNCRCSDRDWATRVGNELLTLCSESLAFHIFGLEDRIWRRLGEYMVMSKTQQGSRRRLSDHPQPADVPATGYISGTRTRDAITQTAQVMQALHEACDSQAVGGPEGQKQPRAPSVERKDKHKCVTSSHESTAVHHPAAPVPFARASSSAGPVREAVIERSEPSRPPKNPSTLTSWTGRVAADPCSVAWNRGCSLNNCQALRPNSRQYSQARPSGSSRRVKSAPPEIKSKTPEEPKNKEIVRPAWSDCHYDGPMSHLEQPESIPEAGESGMPKAENKAEDIAEDAPQAQPKPEDKAEDPPQPQPKPEHSDEGKQSQSEAQDPPTSEKKEPLVELGVGRVLDKIVEETDGDWELLERPVSPEAAVKRTFRNPDGRGYFNNRTCFAARNCAPMLC